MQWSDGCGEMVIFYWGIHSGHRAGGRYWQTAFTQISVGEYMIHVGGEHYSDTEVWLSTSGWRGEESECGLI